MTFQDAFRESMSELFAGIAFLAAVGVGLAFGALWTDRKQ